MSRSSWRRLASVGALLAMLVVIVGAAQLLHTHQGCPMEGEAGCASCELPLLAALVPTVIVLTFVMSPAIRRRVYVPVLLPAGVLMGRPSARGPPAR